MLRGKMPQRGLSSIMKYLLLKVPTPKYPSKMKLSQSRENVPHRSRRPQLRQSVCSLVWKRRSSQRHTASQRIMKRSYSFSLSVSGSLSTDKQVRSSQSTADQEGTGKLRLTIPSPASDLPLCDYQAFSNQHVFKAWLPF